MARRLVGLQALFPGADIAKLVSKRWEPGHQCSLCTMHSMRETLMLHICRSMGNPCLLVCRPGLLLQGVFEHVPAARDQLGQLFPQTDIDAMVQEQPLLLTEDVACCIAELQRLMPTADPLQTLKYNPHM